ncbi:hypothetical protein FRB99_000278, partial [Tulasnella sp. 403]
MASINDLVLQLQLLRDQAPSGTVPLQASMYLAIAFGRSPSDVFTDKELTSCPLYLDHATFIRTVRRLLPLDENGTRAEYKGTAPKDDLRGLLKTFGRDPIEVDDYLMNNVPEENVMLNKFLRILAKPIAGQRYPVGVYAVSRPLDGPATKGYTTHTVTRNARRDRSKAAIGMPVTRDSVALALARRLRYQKYRSTLLRHRSRRNSSGTDTSSESGMEDRD